jgi:hypothetical protein
MTVGELIKALSAVQQDREIVPSYLSIGDLVASVEEGSIECVLFDLWGR